MCCVCCNFFIDSKIKDTSNTNNIYEAYIEESNKTPTIDISLLDDNIPKIGYTPSAPSSFHNMVIDTIDASYYNYWSRLSL
jgi:hypothetical protein